MKKFTVVLSFLLALSLILNGVLLIDRDKARRWTEKEAAAGAAPVIQVLAQMDALSKALDSKQPLPQSFFYWNVLALESAAAACCVIPIELGQTADQGLYYGDPASAEHLNGVFRILRESLVELNTADGEEYTMRREKTRYAFDLLRDIYDQTAVECGLTTIGVSDYSTFFRAMLPRLKVNLAPGGKLYAVMENLALLGT